MAIDTAFKRRSSAASRRMPWMRRFGIAPDGTIGANDRQAAAWVYGGNDLVPVTIAYGPGYFAAGQIHLSGFKAGEVHLPGVRAGQVHLPGFSTGEAKF